MADPPSSPDTGMGPTVDRPPRTPRWVKVFGIIVIVLVLLAVVVLLAGGGRHGPDRHLGAGGHTPSSGGEQKPGGVGGPADPGEAARTVKITTLDTTRFEPSRITVSAGETVTFVVTNTGHAVHDFTLGDAAMQQEHAQAMAHIPAGMAHDAPNSITLEPGTTKQLTWRFGDVATLEYGCHEAGHYQAGMRGQVMVT